LATVHTGLLDLREILYEDAKSDHTKRQKCWILKTEHGRRIGTDISDADATVQSIAMGGGLIIVSTHRGDTLVQKQMMSW